MINIARIIIARVHGRTREGSRHPLRDIIQLYNNHPIYVLKYTITVLYIYNCHIYIYIYIYIYISGNLGGQQALAARAADEVGPEPGPANLAREERVVEGVDLQSIVNVVLQILYNDRMIILYTYDIIYDAYVPTANLARKERVVEGVHLQSIINIFDIIIIHILYITHSACIIIIHISFIIIIIIIHISL